MVRIRTNMFRIATMVLLMSVFLIAFRSNSYAQEDEIQRLRQKITELENRIVDLESLLSRYDAREKLRQGDDLSWENKKNWRKLKIGMNQTEVQAILGKPIKTIEGVRILWYYPNLYCGLVSFDEEGKLAGWNEP